MYSTPFNEPIRKPRFKTRFLTQRHQKLARTLHSRFALFDGRLMLMSREAEFHDLVGLMTSANDWAHVEKDEFLLKTGSDGELTQSTLKRIGASIEHWERSLKNCDRKSVLARERDRQLVELNELKHRLEFAFRALKQPSLAESCFLLDPRQEAELENETRQAGIPFLPRRLSECNHQLARWVYWSGGVIALRRFATAMLETSESETHVIKQVDSLTQWLETLERRWPTEPKWIIAYEFKTNQRLAEFVAFAKGKGVWPTSKVGSFPERIVQHRESLLKLRTSLLESRDRKFPIIIAAWSISTQSGAQLPRPSVQSARKDFAHEHLKTIARQHVEYSECTGYRQTLELINQHNLVLPVGIVCCICDWFSEGNSEKDILFCVQNLSPFDIEKSVSLARLRISAERCRRLLNDAEYKAFQEIHGWIVDDFQVEFIDTVLRWMEKFSGFSLNNQMKTSITSTLHHYRDLMRLTSSHETFGLQIKKWFSQVNAVAECFPDESSFPRQLRVWLRRLGYYQRLSNKKRGLSKSLRKTLLADEKRRKEIEYLSASVEAGNASHKAKERLSYLSVQRSSTPQNERKKVRDTQEACLATGLEALRQMMVHEATRVWVEATGHAIHEKWSEKRIAEIGLWIHEMSGAQIKILRRILDAHVVHGAEYKTQLPFNVKWIDGMRENGFNIAHWVFPNRKLTTINNRKVIISVACDPYEVFMMGNYFGTCLSQGGCNQMSVLANAADANKQVVYVHDLEGNVLARQLLAINRQKKLLRYCLYVATKEVSGEDCWQIYEREMECYCRELADRVGLTPGSDGAPASLGSQFWYDDGAEEWSEESPSSNPEPDDETQQFRGFTIQAGYNWSTVSCTQSHYELMQPRYAFINQ